MGQTFALVTGLAPLLPLGQRSDKAGGLTWDELRFMPIDLNEFEGHWRLDRAIEDARTGGQGRFEGTAVFTPDGDGLRYVETGVLHLAGQQGVSASRSYVWRPDADGVAVFFDDGRPFHRFALVAMPEATHWCDPDDYAVLYDFARWPAWSARWAVKGPRKDYIMTSRYRPATA